jgi:hypothetical protein
MPSCVCLSKRDELLCFRECYSDSVVVQRPGGHMSAEPAAFPGRAAFRVRRAIGTESEPATASADVVKTVSFDDALSAHALLLCCRAVVDVVPLFRTLLCRTFDGVLLYHVHS